MARRTTCTRGQTNGGTTPVPPGRRSRLAEAFLDFWERNGALMTVIDHASLEGDQRFDRSAPDFSTA
jgi:hypothetical protein